MDVSNNQEAALEAKQAYLRDNIDPNLYEDFVDFCSTQTEAIDINSWSLQFIKELVGKFKQSMAEDLAREVVERSFAMYQTSSGGIQQEQQEENHQGSILEQLNQSSQQSQPAFTKKNKQQTPVVTKMSDSSEFKKTPQKNIQSSPKKQQNKIVSPANQSSAVELLDSVFQKSQMEKEPKKATNKLEETSKSFFDSVNFWQVPTLNQPAQSKDKTPSSAPIKMQTQEQRPKQKKKDIEAFNYNNSAGFEYFNTGMPSTVSKTTFDEFNTFSVMTDQELKKGHNNDKKGKKEDNSMKKKAKTQIKIKEVTQYKASQDKSVLQKPKKERKRNKKPRNTNDPNRVKTNFQDTIACIKSNERPYLKQQNLQIKFISHQIISRSIFSSNYLMYHMKVIPTNKVCKRNYEDFFKLRQILGKVYPGIQLPYLQKEGWISDTSDEFANKQKQMLEMFMADILSNRQLRNSRVIQDFLGITEHKSVKRKFQQFSRMDKLKSIEQLCLLQGKVNVGITEQGRIYNQQAVKFTNKLQLNFDKIRKLNESISDQYKHLLDTIKNVTDTIKQMIKDTEEFNDTIGFGEVQQLEDSLKKMRDGYKENYCRIKFQQEIINNDILPFIKYEKQNLHCSKEIMEIRNNFQYKYQKINNSQANSAKDSYISPKYDQFKQGIEDQSKNLVVLKYQTGFWEKQVGKQVERILKWLAVKVEKKWAKIGTKYLNQLSGSVTLWSSVVM